MLIRGTVRDGRTKQPLSGASVLVADANGRPLGQGVIADINGGFSLQSNLIDSNKILFTYAGFTDKLVDPGFLTNPVPIDIPLEPRELQEIVVTPGKGIAWYWWILIIGGGYYVLNQKSK